jgi:zinc protease
MDRARPPGPGEPRPFRFPEFHHLELLPGLHAYIAPLDRAPLLTLQLITPGGGQLDPSQEAGLAAFTAALLDEGTARRSGPELAVAAERLGATLSSSADWDASYVATSGLAPHHDALFELLAEVTLQPSFPEEEVERQRKRRTAELLRRRSMPAAQTEDCLARALYGDGVYGYPILGRAQDLERLDRARAESFYRSYVCRSPATLVAVGDLDLEEVTQDARRLLEGWPAEVPESSPTIVPRPLDGIEVHLVDRPGAPHTELRLGHHGSPANHPRRIPLTVLNTLFGGKFTSRINLNLRERHGYTYGAHSRLPDRLGPGPFVVSTAVDTKAAGAAAREILDELHRLQVEPVEAQELEDTVRYLEGVFAYTVQTVQGVASRLSQLAVYGLGDDFYDRLQERLRAVTRDELLELAREHLHPGRLVIAAAGPAAELRPQLEGLGKVVETQEP